MKTRLARTEDLPQITEMFRRIVESMKRGGVDIWNEHYPFECFEDDIEAGELYLMEDESGIASVFAICKDNDGADFVRWAEPDAAALYFDRFGVNADRQRQGIGRISLDSVARLAKEAGAKYLRLFVVDVNHPAIALYEACSFCRAGGVFEEKINDHITLREYGYELKL